jgi:hypothetical protein
MRKVGWLRQWAALIMGVGLLTVVAVSNFSGGQQAVATHQPADKVVASGSTIEELEPTGQTILSGTLRTSTPEDLILQVTLECSIITDVLVPGGDDKTVSSGESEGRIKVWVVIDSAADGSGGYTVPVTNIGSQQGVGADNDKVTFCNRNNKITITDTEDGDGVDQHENYLRTKDANGFNWLALNLGNGVHKIEVRAEFDRPVAEANGSTSSGLVGNRTLIVQPTKLANDANV